jgi:CBS domain-containing protein
MEENDLTQLPLVLEHKYMALVKENDILDLSNADTPLNASELLGYKPAVLATGHPFEALRVAHQQNLSIVPVVDKDNTYIGAITRNDLLKYIAENSGLESPGGILVLEIEPRNYSLHEIARIAESEDVTIFSSQLFTNRVSGKIEVTIKTNRNDLQGLVQAFERYNYVVKEVFGDQTSEEDLIGRYNLLMNYINM